MSKKRKWDDSHILHCFTCLTECVETWKPEWGVCVCKNECDLKYNVSKIERASYICPAQKGHLNKMSLRVPLWLSSLRMWRCHCSGSGHCCGTDSIPGLETSACCGCSQNKTKQKNKMCLSTDIFQCSQLPLFVSYTHAVTTKEEFLFCESFWKLQRLWTIWKW